LCPTRLFHDVLCAGGGRQVADVRDMRNMAASESYGSVLDKGTLDALL
jgi:hypothetical protein